MQYSGPGRPSSQRQEELFPQIKAVSAFDIYLTMLKLRKASQRVHGNIELMEQHKTPVRTQLRQLSVQIDEVLARASALRAVHLTAINGNENVIPRKNVP